MKFHNSAALFIFFFVFFAKSQGEETSTEATDVESEEGNKTKHYSPCDWSDGHYSKNIYFTCCRNTTLDNPINETDIWEPDTKCVLEFNKTDTDDLPTAMWKEHVCIIKTKGGVLKTFKGYMDFISGNYTEPYKSEIINSAVGQCVDGDAEGDEIKRIEMFQRCLYRIERKVCHRPSENVEETSYPNPYHRRIDYCKPTDDFPSGSGSICCKGKPIPRELYYYYERSLANHTTLTEVENCSKHFVKLQKELNPSLETREEQYEKIKNTNRTIDRLKLANDCWPACYFNSGIPNKLTDLKIDLEMLIKNNFFPFFPKSLRTDLNKLIVRYASEKNYVMPDNSTIVSIEEAAKSMMESKDELNKILLYCNVQRHLVHFIIGAFDEYCFDEKFSLPNYY